MIAGLPNGLSRGIRSMRVSGTGWCAVLLLTLALPSLAGTSQNAPTVSGQQSTGQAPADSTQPQPTTPPPASAHQRTRCWQQAGISPAAMNQRWKIQDNAKGRINQVCTDPTLSPEKKHDRIGQINQETDQEIAKIIPAKQLETFKACEAERDREQAKHPPKTGQKELGPCGGVIPEQPASPQHSHEQPHHPSSH